jgi:hypothetical protein
MPFLSSVEGTFGFGRPFTQAQTGNAPAYYTSTSGFFMYMPGYAQGSMILKSASNLNNATNIRTYGTVTNPGWTIIADKDLDSNVYYTMAETTRIFSRIVLVKGGTTLTQSTICTYTGATTSVLGSCYAPACMWTTTAYGAFIIGGFSQSVIHVLEFSAAKTCNFSYTVPYVSEVYGTEVIPAAASGFTSNFGVAYTRTSKQMSSWTVNMDTRSWTNRKDNSYTSGTTGPANGDGMIYYPPGKPIFTGETATATNRLAMNDTSSSNLYVWTVTQQASTLTWTYLSTIAMINNGGYPYSMSVNAYNSIA